MIPRRPDDPWPWSVAPEFARIVGPLTPAPGQVGSMAEQMLKAHLPRPTRRKRASLTPEEIERFVLAAVASVLAARGVVPAEQPQPFDRGTA